MIEIARITAPHGIRGDVKVRLYSESYDDFCQRGFAYLKNTEGLRRIAYQALRVDPPFVYMHFDGVNTRSDAERLKNAPLFVRRGELAAPDEGEYYIADMLGLPVFANGRKLGVLEDVLQHGAADVYVVTGEKNFMFPALKRVIKKIDIAAGVIEVDEAALGRLRCMTTYNVLTLFPGMFASVCASSIWARAGKAGLIEINPVDIRDYAFDKHRRADDYPMGGGAGMVLKPEPVDACFHDVVLRSKKPFINVYMSPCGKRLRHPLVLELAQYRTINILCGHYEGVDARVLKRHINLEISVGDFVLTGGEIAAMALIDASIRHVEGVLGNRDSATGESFSDSLLEYPQYTQPAVWNGECIPEVLLSGHHANVYAWRRRKSLEDTARKRPDLFSRAKLNKTDIAYITKEDERPE
jgi:tRNA (guanine37-N1)-methyltransferase